MKPVRIAISVTVFIEVALSGNVLAQPLPALPEPPLIIYGQVFSKYDNSPVAITSAVWTVSDSQGDNATLSATSSPPIQIVTVNGLSYYMAQIPFDTLAAGQASFTPQPNSIPLQVVSPVYTRTAVVNGLSATLAMSSQGTFTYGVGDRGRVDQVNLFINSTGYPNEAYLDWARAYFGNASLAIASTNADADGTGQNNYFKYVAGLNPTNSASVFELDIAAVSGQHKMEDLIFNPLATGRTYTVQFSTNLVGAVYTNLTSYTGPQTNASTLTVTVTDTNAVQPFKFYRIDISLP
jgi:hypothetical protein